MDPDVRDRILDRPRARELRSWQPPETSVKELREKIGGAGVSDDELLLCYFTSEEDVRAMKQAPARAGNGGNLVGLIRSLTERSETKQIFIRRPDLSVRLGRNAAVSLPHPGALCEARTERAPHRNSSL